MPTIVPLFDGSFIASQHVGSSLGANDCHIEILRSPDGKTWRNEGGIHGDGLPQDGFSYRGPRISVVPDGRLVMTATRFETTEGNLFDPDSEALQRPEMLFYCSRDEGRTWSASQPTNLRGQVCTPIPLADGRVAAIYNFRHDSHGIRVALSEDLATFDTDDELVVFDAGAEATLGDPGHQNFLAEHMLIAFGKPGGIQLDDGDVLVYFWCTTQGVTHTRWARLSVD